MTELSLYSYCLRRVSLLLKDGFWKSGCVNPFCFLPCEVVQDLVSTTLHLQHPVGFRAADLELLLSSGQIREFKINAMHVNRELGPALKYLASACQDLEVITLTELTRWNYSYDPDATEALQELLRKSFNLKIIHCLVKFDLKDLRNCKKLRKIMLHFQPEQPWYDFLEENHGCLQPQDFLELFTLCDSCYSESHSVVADYMATLLRYCPALSSFGLLDTSRALAQLKQTPISSQVKLRCCYWGKSKFPDYDNSFEHSSAEWIRDAVAYYPFVKELHFDVHSMPSVAYLGGLRNLVFLDIRTKITGVFSIPFYNAIKDIGLQLKYLSLNIQCPIDISVVLQYCPCLVALRIWCTKLVEFVKSAVSLPNLKYLTLLCHWNADERRILPLISDCHNLRELFMMGTCSFDDETLDKFLRRNSFSNLKIAFFQYSGLGLTQHGFRKFFTSASELEKIEVVGYISNEKFELERRLKRALLQTNHKAIFNKKLVSYDDEFFVKKRNCNFY